jgi:hypothetical protein
MAGLLSPDTGNLLIGKGFILFQPDGNVDFYHLGNCPSLTITPKTVQLDHFSSMEGTKLKDLTVVTEKSMEVKVQMEEFTANNIATLMLGDIDDSDPDAPVINMFTRASLTGHLKFYAANDVGPRWYIDIPSITFNPSGDFAPISDAFASMEITGTVNSVGGVWGTITLAPAVDAVAPENLIEPFISGSPIVGFTLTASVGGWVGADSFTYLWKAAGGAAAATATNKTYIPAAGDVGKTMTVDVTATNNAGSTGPITSDATAAVTAS